MDWCDCLRLWSWRPPRQGSPRILLGQSSVPPHPLYPEYKFIYKQNILTLLTLKYNYRCKYMQYINIFDNLKTCTVKVFVQKMVFFVIFIYLYIQI